MNEPSKMSLAEARKQGKLDEFIAEHENDPSSEKGAFDRTVAAMAGKSSATPAASPKDRADD